MAQTAIGQVVCVSYIIFSFNIFLLLIHGDKMQTVQRDIKSQEVSFQPPFSSGGVVSCVPFYTLYVYKHGYLFLSGEHFTSEVRIDASQLLQAVIRTAARVKEAGQGGVPGLSTSA